MNRIGIVLIVPFLVSLSSGIGDAVSGQSLEITFAKGDTLINPRGA